MRTFSESTRQTILAVFIGPLSIIPAMAAAQTFIFLISPANTPDIAEQYWGGFLISAIGLLYSYGFTFLYGVPVYIVLKKLQINRAVYIFVASLVPAVVFFIMSPDAWPIYLAIAYFSVIVGFSCWFIALRGGKQGSNNQLNQDAPNSGAPVS
jgi:hypothetical protein